MYKRWTEEEVQFLKDNYSEKGPKWCSERLDRSRMSATKKAQGLKLYCYKRWTEEEELFLINNYENKGPKWCSEKLDRTYHATVRQAGNFYLEYKNRTSGLKGYEPCFLYLIYFSALNLYKVGVSKNIKQRGTGWGHKYIVLDQKLFATGTEALKEEQEILKGLDPFLHDSGLLLDGNTETFLWP